MSKDDKTYISNPFSITFKGLSMLIDYAKSTFIALIVISVLGFGFNAVGDIANFTQDSNQNVTINYENNQSLEIGTIEKEEAIGIGVTLALIIAILFVVGVLVATLINATVNGTIAAAANSATDKKEITLGQALRKMSERFGTLYMAILIATARTIGGYLLLIIPGIRAQLRYTSLPYIIMSDKNIGYEEALSKSKDYYKGHLMEVFGIMTVGGIIPFVGSSLAASGLSLSHKQIANYNSSGKQFPKTHWLNYLGFILVGFFIIFAGLILLLVYTLIN